VLGLVVIGGLFCSTTVSTAEPKPFTLETRPSQRAAALKGAPPHLAEQLPGKKLSLQAAIEMALRDNPGLAEVQGRAEAMAALPAQVGALPDPALRFQAMDLPVDTFDRRQEAMTQLQIGISQAFPFPGKLGLRQRAAEYEAAAAGDDVNEIRLLLIRDVKQAWWSLFYLDQALVTVKRNQDLMRQFVEIAQTKYRVGEGLQQDVLLAQLELSKLLDLEVRLTALRRTGEARLNALLNWPTDRSLFLPREVEMELVELEAEEIWQRRAEKNRPVLAAEQNRVEAARERLDLAKKDYYPDFEVGAAYGFRSGTDPMRGETRPDFATFMLSMSVPLYAGRKQAMAVDQRSSEVLSQIFTLQDRRQQVREEISTALAGYRRARQQFLLFKTGIVPQARQTVDSMLAGYQVGKVDFLNLVSAQITLYNYETEYWKVLAEAYQTLAELAAAVGRERIHE
jgi:outer membrane protein, heavy metal efflux system